MVSTRGAMRKPQCGKMPAVPSATLLECPLSSPVQPAMKRLFLVRHAKSSWADPGARDFDRPLNERGKKNAPEMGERLVARGQLPQLIVSSPARRALSTAQLIADACGIARAGIDIVDELYESTPATWLGVIRALPAGVERSLIVGHNPEITEIANRLCRAARIDNMPTCGVLYLDFAVAVWSAIGRVQPDVWSFDYPKQRPG